LAEICLKNVPKVVKVVLWEYLVVLGDSQTEMYARHTCATDIKKDDKQFLSPIRQLINNDGNNHGVINLSNP
jgi:hypothetical protein